MSDTKDICAHGTAVTLAVLGFAGSGAATAVSLAALAGIGLTTFRDDRQACEAAVAEVMARMRHTERPETLAEAARLLRDTEHRTDIRPGRIPDPTDAGTLDAALVDRIMDHLPGDAGFDAASLLRTVFQHAVAACRYRPEIHATITQDLLWRTERAVSEGFADLGDLGEAIRDDVALLGTRMDRNADEAADDRERKQQELLAAIQSLQSNLTPDAQVLVQNEALVVSIIRHYAERDVDLQSAITDIGRALEAEATEQARAGQGSNLLATIDAVLARIAALSRRGEIEAALGLLDDAVEEVDAMADASKTLLFRRGISLARLADDPETAARHAWDEAALSSEFDLTAARSLQDRWYVEGRDRGALFDLRVSERLAIRCMGVAPDAASRATIQNDLAISLQTLGERVDADGLNRAVAAYEAALEVRTRDALPVDWAMTQNNLGNALATLGERGDADALRRAVAAFEAALEVRTRDALPVDWAMTRFNQALCSDALAAQEPEAAGAHRSAALAAIDDALTVMTEDAFPDWHARATRIRAGIATG